MWVHRCAARATSFATPHVFRRRRMVPPSVEGVRWFQEKVTVAKDAEHPSQPTRTEEEEALEEAALRVTRVGAGVNVALAGAKAVAGWLLASEALIADALHSCSDLVSDAVTFAVVHVSNKPADTDHPHGHGRIESLGSLFVSALLIGSGVGMGFHSFSVLGDMADLVASSAAALPEPNGYMIEIGLGVAVASIVSKELLYQWTNGVAKRNNSTLLEANAWHHRTDALSSTVALAGVAGLKLGVPMLDPLAGLLVAGMVARVGLKFGWQSLRELSDEALDVELLHDISGVLQSTDGVLSYRGLRARRMGRYRVVDVQVRVDHRRHTISSAVVVADRARRAIQDAHPEVSETLVSLYTDATPAGEPEDLKANVAALVEQFDEVEALTHVRVHFDAPSGRRAEDGVDEDVSQAVVEFEMVVAPDYEKMTLEEVYALAERVAAAAEAVRGVKRADVHLELNHWHRSHPPAI